jgi:putative ABC transport system ATP-binding protein
VIPVVELQRVQRTYRSGGGVLTPALRGVDLSVESGEFVAIMGASGSGKSTLMNIIGLLDRGFVGTYALDGLDVRTMSENEAATARNERIGFVFQQFHLLPRATVLDNVLLPATYRRTRDARARALEVIERVGLADRVGHRSNQLSGGQMQRVAIARALLMRPSLVLADEPTGNLDSQTAHDVMKLLGELHDDGSTVLLITHEHDIAEHAQRVVHLRDGRVVDEVAA